MQIAIADNIVYKLNKRERRVNTRAQLDQIRADLDVQKRRLEFPLLLLLLQLVFVVDEQPQLEQVGISHANVVALQIDLGRLCCLCQPGDEQVDVLDVEDEQGECGLGGDVAGPVEGLEGDEGTRGQVERLVENAAVVDVEVEFGEDYGHLVAYYVDVDEVEELD